MFLLFYLDSSKCCNCKRLQFDTDVDSAYNLQFHLVKSNEIRRAGHKCQFICQIVSEKNICDYNLCNECFCFLVKKEQTFENTWPGFLWNLLTGWHQPAFGSRYYYHKVYPGKHSWQIIPLHMQPW